MSMAVTWATVALFGALGALARFEAGARIAQLRPGDFRWGTFTVNLSGGFALGLLVGLGVTGDAMLTVGAGLLGGYTVFFGEGVVNGRKLARRAGAPGAIVLPGAAGLIRGARRRVRLFSSTGSPMVTISIAPRDDRGWQAIALYTRQTATYRGHTLFVEPVAKIWPVIDELTSVHGIVTCLSLPGYRERAGETVRGRLRLGG